MSVDANRLPAPAETGQMDAVPFDQEALVIEPPSGPAPEASGRFRAGLLARAAIYATAALAAGGALVSTAEARPAKLKIVPGHSIGGVKLGERGKQVQHELGKPTSTDQYGKIAVWRYARQPLFGVLSLEHGKVTGVDTYSKRQKTNKGIGPGSSFAATTRKYPGAKCEGSAIGDNAQVCVIDSKIGRRKVETIFLFSDQSKPMQEVDIDFK